MVNALDVLPAAAVQICPREADEDESYLREPERAGSRGRSWRSDWKE